MSDDDLDALLDDAFDDLEKTEEEGKAERAAQHSAIAANNNSNNGLGLPGGMMMPPGLTGGMGGNDAALLQNVQTLMQALTNASMQGGSDNEEGLGEMHTAIRNCISALQSDAQSSPEERSKLQRLASMLDRVDPGHSASSSDSTSQQDKSSTQDEAKEMEEMMKELMADIHSTAGKGGFPGGMDLPSLPSIPEDMTEEQANLVLQNFANAMKQHQSQEQGASSAESATAAAPKDQSQNPAELELMRAILSNPDAILEPFRKLSVAYPDWLQQNKGCEDHARYEEQYRTMQDVIQLFEGGNLFGEAMKIDGADNDEAQEAQRKMNTFMGMVEKLQSLGSPPQGLVEAVNGSPAVDEAKAA